MDAGQKILTKTALFLAIGLLLVAPAMAQSQLVVSSNFVNLTTNQAIPVSVTSTGTPITFAVSGVPSWLNFGSDSSTTPANVTFQIGNSNCALLPGGCNAAVVLTPQGAGNGTAVTIQVNYTPGTGGGNSSVTASTTSLSFSAPSGQIATAQTLSLNTTSPNPLAINSATSDASWLTVSLSSFSVSSASPVIVTVQASAVGLANGPVTGHINIVPQVGSSITITVTFNVGTGTGTGTLTGNPTSLSFTYQNGVVSPSNQFLNVFSSNNSTVTYNASATSQSNWLLIGNNQTQLTGTVGFAFQVTVNATVAAQLGTGTFQGTITLTNPNNINDTTQIPVSLSTNGAVGNGLTVSPTTLNFNSVPNGNQQSSAVSVTVPTTSTLVTATVFYTSGVNFLSVSPTSFFGSQNPTITVFPANLAAGTYSAQVQFSASGFTTQSVNVSLTISTSGTGGGTGTLASPTNLTFAYQANTNSGNVSPQTVSVGGTGSFTVSAPTVNTAQQWLSLTTPNGTTAPTGYVTASINPSGLAVGQYPGSFIINTSGGAQTVNVTLNVTSSAVLESFPGSMNVQGSFGTSPGAQFSILASDNSTQQISVTPTASWISISLQNTTTPTSAFASFNINGLCNGLNTAAITVAASGVANSPLTIPVVVNVTGSSVTSGCSNGGGGTGSGPLTISSTGLTFNAAPNGAQPASQTFNVTPPTNTTIYSIDSSVTSGGQNWLSVTPVGATFGSNVVTVSVSQNGLAIGTYNGQVTFTTNGQVQTVPVTLNVGTNGALTANPTSLTFNYQPGGANPATQDLAITSTSGASGLQFTYSVSSTSNFLSATANGTQLTNGQALTTPARITVTVNPTGLTPGQTYTGNIVLTPSGGAPITIPVSLVISSQPAVTATPTSLSFNYNAGDPTPAAQTVQVTGGTGLPFSAQASSTGNWLVVSPASGTTPGSLSVTVNPTGLAANTYTGTITVSGTGTATGSTTISVTLKVTAPLSTITSLANAASYIGGSISPGEIITIFGTGLGPTPAVTLAIDPATGKVATTLGGTQVLVNGFPAPLIFASATQVSAVVPYEVAGFLTASVVVKYLGQSSNGIPSAVATTAPGIFTANASGSGPGAILNANGSVNSPANPANKGDTVAIYMTGEGQTSPGGITGKVTTVASTSPITPVPLLPVAALVDGMPASISFAGEAPSLVSGAAQVNVRIPDNAHSGPVSLVISVGGSNSQAGVTVSVR